MWWANMLSTKPISLQRTTDTKYLQAHKHWLSLMKVSSKHALYGSWKAHHDRMCDDPDMLKWSWAWQSHDKQLHSSFMDCLSIIHPDSITYCHQFKHARLDSWMNLQVVALHNHILHAWP